SLAKVTSASWTRLAFQLAMVLLLKRSTSASSKTETWTVVLHPKCPVLQPAHRPCAPTYKIHTTRWQTSRLPLPPLLPPRRRLLSSTLRGSKSWINSTLPSLPHSNCNIKPSFRCRLSKQAFTPACRLVPAALEPHQPHPR